MSLKTFKYRLSPTKRQDALLQWALDRNREVYNAALQERRDAWTVCKQHPNFYDPEWRTEHARDYSVNCYDQINQLPDIKEDREEYQGIYSQVLQDTLRRVDKSFKAFFRRVMSGQVAGYPRFQGKDRYDSFCYPQSGFSVEKIGKSKNKLVLSKVGHITIKLHRPIQGNIKSCTIKREGQHWYVCFACEIQVYPRTPYTDSLVGVDMGVSKLATLSTGDVIENPKHYRHAQAKLASLQQKVARKKRGSHRREKALARFSKAHRVVRSQRQDYLHKQSRNLVNTYETIVFEDIKPGNMSKRAKPKQDEETGEYLPNGASAKSGLNKSILDAGWSTFIFMCTYKAENAGMVQVVKVDPKYTSQKCSQCGVTKKKQLSERWHSCECGCELDRDHNAAINIARLGSKHQAGA
jgi:putative transposase